MGREANLLRSEAADKRNPTSSEGDRERGWAEAGDHWQKLGNRMTNLK